MAELTQIKYLSLTGLSKYDAQIKTFINTKVSEGDAQSFKYVNLEDGVLKFYTINPISDDTVPAFEIELPVQDLSHLMQLVQNATAGNIATFGENGQVVDSGIKAADIATKEEVQTVQDSVNELADLVGELPEGTSATSVVDYVNIKTAGIATDTALEELNNQVSGLQTAVQGIQEDYLTSEDKTELQDQITANANAIELLTNGVSAEEVDGVNDLIQYVKDHGTEVTAMQKAISDNTTAIDTEVAERETLAGRVTALEQLDHEAYIEADTALKTELETEIAKKADSSVVVALEEAYKAADTTLSGRIDILEGVSHSHENATVLADITAEKVEAWDASEGNAKTYIDEAIAKIDLSGIDTNTSAITSLQEKDVTIENNITSIQEDIAELQAVQHQEITEEEIDALFAVSE